MSLIATGGRDRLIVRLLGFGMETEAISRLTGAPSQRVQRIAGNQKVLLQSSRRGVRIRQLRSLGMKRDTIALRLGCSTADVDAVLRSSAIGAA
jgi:hypothetical protein